MVGCYIVNQVYDTLILSYFIGGLSVVIIILSFHKASALFRTVGLLFLLTGCYIWLFITPLGIEILLHFDSLIGLMALFFLLPFMNAIVKLGRYDHILSSIITKNTTKLSQLYTKMSLTSYVLTIFLVVATLPVLLSAVHERIKNFSKEFKETFLTHGILRPYGLVLLWSPTEMLVAVTIDFTNEKYLTLLPILFSISVLFLIIDLLIHKIKYRKIELPAVEKSDEEIHPLFKRKITEFIIAILLFISAILVLNQIFTQGFLFTIISVILPFSFIWSLLIKRPQRFKKLGVLLIKNNERSFHGMFFLFLSAGLFVNMIPYTTVFDHINILITEVHQDYSLFVFYLFIGLLILILALIGFHPMVSIAIIIPFLQGFLDELSLGIAITIIGASLSTNMFGPFNVSPTFMAVLLNRSPYHITSKNFLFALCFVLTTVFIAYIITI